MIFYDAERIFNDCEPYSVARYIQIPTEQMRGKTFCICPCHPDYLGRLDKNIGSCCLTNNGYYCFACHNGNGVSSLVSDYYRNYRGVELSYTELLEILADSCGGSSLYEISRNDYKQKSNDRQPLKPDELLIIGLKSNGTSVADVIEESDSLTNSSQKKYYFNEETGDLETENLITKPVLFSINTLYKEDKKAYHFLVTEKIKEELKYYQRLFTDINRIEREPHSNEVEKMYRDVKVLCIDRYHTLSKMWVKVGNKEIKQSINETLKTSKFFVNVNAKNTLF